MSQPAHQRTIVNPVIKDEVTFLRTADETGGACTEVEVTLMPGGGTPLHYHRLITETFTVVSGVLGLQIGREVLSLEAGRSVTVQPGTIHRFYNDGDEPVRFQTVITPGHEGFEQSLRIMYGLAADGLTNSKSIPKKLSHLAVITAISDMHTTGLLALMAPLIRHIAAKDLRNGEAKALTDRYCR